MNFGLYRMRELPRSKAKRKKRRDVYTQSEAARKIGIPRIYVRLLIEAGRLDAQPTPRYRKVYYNPTQWDAARESWRAAINEHNRSKS